MANANNLIKSSQKPQSITSKSQRSVDKETRSRPWTIDLDEPDPGVGPAEGAYTAFAVLDPLITVELLDQEYRLSVRFNLQTRILHLGDHDSSGQTRFLDFVDLQYIAFDDDEKSEGQPGPDSKASFVVTSTSGKSRSVDIGANAGSPMNSTGNVHVGMVRNANVSVEETVNSWAVSSHRVLGHAGGQPVMTNRTWQRVKSYFTGGDKRRINRQSSGWKWHWKGRQADTNRLNLDQTDCVMRHVVLTRFIPVDDIVAIFDEREDIDQERAARLQRKRLKQLLTFNFEIAIGVRQLQTKLFHRERGAQYDRDKNPGSLLHPIYRSSFTLGAGSRNCKQNRWPKSETRSIEKILGRTAKQIQNLGMPVHPDKERHSQNNTLNVEVDDSHKQDNKQEKKKSKKKSNSSDTEDPSVTWYNDTFGYQKNQGQSVLVTYSASDYDSQA